MMIAKIRTCGFKKRGRGQSREQGEEKKDSSKDPPQKETA